MNLFGTENMIPSNNSEGSSGKKNNGSKKRRFPTEGGNVFQEYMSRKIELQRQQFGLMVPPAPTQSQTGNETGKRRKIDSSGMKSVEEESSSDNENTSKKDKSRNTFGGFDMNEVLSQLEMSQQQQQHQACDPSNTHLERNTEKSSRKDLFFRGVVVLINGKTDPDTPTLMRMLHKHGGDVEKYETSRVTQIIAENISNAKQLNYQKKRKRTPIVHPQWITDSVRAERLLHYQDYLLIEGGQKNMRHFFAKESNNRNNNNIDRNLSTAGQEDLQIPVRNSSEKATSTIPTTTRANNNNNNNKSRKTVGNDPNFLESYFNNSRLSFIGSFQQRLKRQNRIRKHGMDKSNSSNATRYVLHVDIDSFFASVVLRNYPQYKNSPVAIGHAATNSYENSSMNARTNNSKSTCELSTCNYIARDFGVKKGMWLHHARSLCPHLIILNYDFDAYEEVSGQVTEILEEYADLYSGAVEQVSCDEAYVELYISNENEREGEQKNRSFQT